ncbi:RevS (revS) [Streptococcus suis]|nr:RevS (revS) [Streptococcus suis]
MKIIKSIVLAVGTLLLTLLIQFPAYVGITAFQENVY